MRPWSLGLLVLVEVLLLAPERLRAADETPKPLAFARYQPMMERSPFAVATAVAPPPVAPEFAKDFYVANAARTTNGDFVTLASNVDKVLKEYISSKETNPHGFSISNIDWSEKVGETKVTIAKEGQFATLGFNQALLSQPLQVGNPNPAMANPLPVNVIQPQPGLPQPQPVPGALPVPVPSGVRTFAPTAPLPTPPPHVRGVIPRTVPAPPVSQPVREDQ